MRRKSGAADSATEGGLFTFSFVSPANGWAEKPSVSGHVMAINHTFQVAKERTTQSEPQQTPEMGRGATDGLFPVRRDLSLIALKWSLHETDYKAR